MTERATSRAPSRSPNERAALLVAVVGVASLLVVVAVGIGFSLRTAPSPGPPLSELCTRTVAVSNTTALLGNAFDDGAVWGVGTNATSVLAGGTEAYAAPTDINRPALVELEGASRDAKGINLTTPLGVYFADGGIYAATGNGTTWMIGGQGSTSPGAAPSPVLIEWNSSGVVNLTAEIVPYFGSAAVPGGPSDLGVWSTAWNGSAWLVGGTGASGAVLLAVRDGEVTPLTLSVPGDASDDYVIVTAWNGTGWLIGGFGILDTYAHGAMTDLLGGSPFAGSGVYGADWNGTSWLLGGGSPSALAVLEGERLVPGPALPASFRGAWVNSIVALPSSVWIGGCSGWLLAGLGLTGSGAYTSALALWVPGPSGAMVDLTGLLPSSFVGGEVEDATWAPSLGPYAIVLSGQGDLNLTSGASVGALAVLSIDGEST